MNQGTSHIASREKPEQIYNMEGFYKKKLVGTRKLLEKENKWLFQARLPSIRGRWGSFHADYLSFFWGMEKAHVTNYFIATDHKIPDQLIKITILKVETEIRSGIVSRFGFMSFSTKWLHLGPVIFLFNSCLLSPTPPG